MASGILASGSTLQAATPGGQVIIYTCPAGKTATVKLTVTTDILSFAVTAPATNSLVNVMTLMVNTPNIPRLSINGAPFTFNANISAISSTLLSVNCGGVLELSYVLAAGQTLYFTNTTGGTAAGSTAYLYASHYTSAINPSFVSSVGYTVTGYEE